MEEAFDVLWNDDETFLMGNLEWKVLHLPGHTPDHVGYQCGDAVFVGDSIFLVSMLPLSLLLQSLITDFFLL